jgi:hypothetical protein
MHVMIDQPDEDHDRAVAGHILAVHQLKPAALSARYSMAQMQRYIKYVRAIKPQLSEAVSALPPSAVCTEATAHVQRICKGACCCAGHAEGFLQ